MKGTRVTMDDILEALAIDLFIRGIVSVERAAELAGLSLYDFIHELRRRGITVYPYSDEELEEELGVEWLVCSLYGDKL